MASATSDISKVRIYTGNAQQRRSGKGSSVTNHYKTEVTTLADGSIKKETYRVDAKGNNSVKILETLTSGDPPTNKTTILSTASKSERRVIQDKNSTFNKAISKQTKQAADKALESNIDPVTKKTIDKAAGGSGNDAQQPEDGDSQTSLLDQSANTTKDFGSGPNMQYPSDIAPNQDVVTFTALSYDVKELTGFTFSGRDRVTPGSGGGRSRGTVTLPIQSGIKDQNAAGWGEDTMTAGDIAKAGIALKTIMEGGGGFSESIGTLANQAVGSSEDLAKLVGTKFAENAAGVKGLLSRTQGIVQNPNLELLFQKPTLRPFSFQFRLSARSVTERNNITRIIRFFKQNMAPQKGGGSGGESANLFLKAPNTFQVHYLNRSSGSAEEHEYIGRIKECAMTSFEVDYTPDGNYATYADGSMMSYTISMSFKELEPVFYEDYEDIPEDQIGF